MVQGLRISYKEHGYIQLWRVNQSSGEASGNPSTNNHDITLLRRVHRVILAKHGDRSIKSLPVTVAIVCSHAENFSFGGRNPANLRDIELHSILVLGMHLGLRFDEIYKLKVEHIQRMDLIRPWIYERPSKPQPKKDGIFSTNVPIYGPFYWFVLLSHCEWKR